LPLQFEVYADRPVGARRNIIDRGRSHTVGVRAQDICAQGQIFEKVPALRISLEGSAENLAARSLDSHLRTWDGLAVRAFNVALNG
jgi:hypothetical protein